jgi:beta-xylosidase
MKTTTAFLLVLGLVRGAFAATYANPILAMDFSDPDVCAGPDGKYYLTAASFGGLPGLPILASDDLVNWQYVGHALRNHPFETESPEHGNAVWAPSIRYRKGAFIIYWGDPDRGIYRTTATTAAGPWSEPVLVKPGKGLVAPCPLYDDDGRIYLVHGWAQSRSQLNGILTVSELNADETATVGDETLVYDGLPDGNFAAEGPKFYKRDGAYWLFFPAGGVETGWQVAARSDSPFGPYAARTVMAQGKTKVNGPHQGAWVHTSADEDWFVHFSDRDAYGRIVYLEPMAWRADGWPVIGADADGDGCGEPVGEYAMPKGGSRDAQVLYPQLDDEFDAPRLGPQWQYLGRTKAQVGFPTTRGVFRLYSTPGVRKWLDDGAFANSMREVVNTWNTPNALVQKFPAFAFTATMKAQVGAKQDNTEAGLVVQGTSYVRLGLRAKGESFDVVYTECLSADKGKDEKSRTVATVKAEAVEAGLRSAKVKDVWLRVEVRPSAEIPPKMRAPAALCTFSYSLDGETWTVAGREPFTAAPGKRIGAMVGFYAGCAPDVTDRGWIDVDWFHVDRPPNL